MSDEQRRCAACGEHKPLTEFPVKRRWENGNIRDRGYYCRPCDNRKRRERHQRRTHNDPARRGRDGLRVRGDPFVDAAPLRQWLTKAFKGMDTTEIAAILGISERQFNRYVREDQPTVSVYTADHILTRAGRPDVFAVLYPL